MTFHPAVVFNRADMLTHVSAVDRPLFDGVFASEMRTAQRFFYNKYEMQPWYEEAHLSEHVNHPGDVCLGLRTCAQTFPKSSKSPRKNEFPDKFWQQHAV